MFKLSRRVGAALFIGTGRGLEPSLESIPLYKTMRHDPLFQLRSTLILADALSRLSLNLDFTGYLRAPVICKSVLLKTVNQEGSGRG